MKKGGCSDVQLSWDKAVSRISALIEANRYLSAEEEERYERNHLESARDGAEPDLEADEISENGEPVQEASDRLETVQAAARETEAAPPVSVDEAAGVSGASNSESVADTEIASANGLPTMADAPSVAAPEISTGMDALEKVGVCSLSPILRSIEGVISWELVSDFFRNCKSEQTRADFLKTHFQMYRRRSVRVNVNGQEGIRAAIFSEDERMEIHSEDARIAPFRVALTWTEVCRAMENELGSELTPESVLRDYAAVKLEHKDDILLYQAGDFYQMYGEDAELAAPLLGVNLGVKPIFDGAEEVSFCGVPVESLELYVKKLREVFDVTISGVQASTGERTVISLLSFGHAADVARFEQAEREANSPAAPVKPETSVETERQADSPAAPVKPETSVEMEREADSPAVSVKPETSVEMEREADSPVVSIKPETSVETEREADSPAVPVKPETSVETEREADSPAVPVKPEAQTPVTENAPRLPATQEDIDNALRRWNGDMDSKRAVVRYMNDHARERETAAWLSQEFDGQRSSAFHAAVPGKNLEVDVPWPKVQRRIAQLIKQEKFFTEEELNNFENIDPVEIKEALAERGIVNGNLENPAALENDAFIRQATADAERAAALEEQPEEAASLRTETAEPEIETITPDPEDISVLDADGSVAATQAEKFDPFAPPYHAGDTVWLENVAFQITDIRTYDVELLDPTLVYPIYRAENRAQFEIMLYRDPRNAPVTEYLAANLKGANGDLLGVLTEDSGLLKEADRARIAGWILAGEGNSQIAQRLPGVFGGRSGAMTLLAGAPADYFATETGLEIRVSDTRNGKLNFYWPEIATVLRVKFQQEREGFYRDPAMEEPVNLPGTLRYQVGDSVVVPYPDRYITGTVGYIGSLEVRIDTGSEAWENEVVNRIRFEEAVRHNERNAHLFQPEEKAPEIETPEPDGASAVRQVTDGAAGTERRAEASPAAVQEMEPDSASPVPLPETADSSASEVPGAAGGLSAQEDFCPYKVGDAVFLNNSVFQITDIRRGEVQLEERSLVYPVRRVESREQFERLLRRDVRNDYITELFPNDITKGYDDLMDALTGDGGLLQERMKEWVAGWFRAGENNLDVAKRLSMPCEGTAKNMTLSSGEKADYLAYHDFLKLHIFNEFDTRRTFHWHEVAEVLRAMYQQERGGFSHKAHEETEHLEAQPVRQEAEQSANAVFPSGGDVAGTAALEGEAETRPDSAAVAPVQDVEAVRQETEQSANAVFPSDVDVAGTVAVEEGLESPADTGALPDTVAQSRSGEIAPQEESVQEIPVSAVSIPENPVPAAKNFRITDDHLGEGGAKAKFRANMDAIYTLKIIERQGRSATKEEQEILSRYVGWGGVPEAFDPEKPGWRFAYQELESTLTPDEYAAARASTLNAHYTSPVVIKAVYQAIENMGFKKGNILEPSCGVGNFLGLLPESMSASNLYGVELDSVTGRIAQQLYPKAQIDVQGYEKTDYPRDFFDLAIGNVPFGNYQVNDPAYNKLGFNIHNYFFAKALDQVRPGGVIAFLTSRYTLDSQSSDVREYLSKRAKLLGAIRLPNDAFKANAGTKVVSDIIFLQKSDAPIVEQPDWTKVGLTGDGFLVNRYFLNHPEMVLGLPTSESTQYGRQDYTVAPMPDANLAELLSQAIRNIHGEIKEAELPDLL